MPSISNHSILNIRRGLKAFLDLEAGLTRSELPNHAQELRRARERIKEQEKELRNLRTLNGEHKASSSSSIRPENIIWIFGTARTGSTWLARMMHGLPKHSFWDEPLVGAIFGSILYPRSQWENHSKRGNFIMGKQHQKTYLNSIREFTLDGAMSRFPQAESDNYVVVKEPHGSLGAPLLMQALPESRMIFLARDPRDVAASGIDAHKDGGWAAKSRDEASQKAVVEQGVEKMTKARANMYLRDVSAAKEAYESHTGYKSLVRYEDLRVDSLSELRRVYSEIGIDVSEEEMARSVEAQSWEKVPDKEKGSGKSKRKATPGGWQEDLTPKQVEIVEKITAPLLKEFYGA